MEQLYKLGFYCNFNARSIWFRLTLENGKLRLYTKIPSKSKIVTVKDVKDKILLNKYLSALLEYPDVRRIAQQDILLLQRLLSIPQLEYKRGE
jgi:hypothetical protein